MTSSKTKYILLFILTLFLTNIFAQEVTCYTCRNKKATDLYESAIKKRSTNIKSAIDLLHESLKVDPRYVEACFLLAELYFENASKGNEQSLPEAQISESYNNSEKLFRKVTKNCKQFNDYESFFYLGKVNYKLGNYIESKKNLTIYIDNTKQSAKKKEADNLRNNISEYLSILQNPVQYKPYKIGGIDSENDEYLPFISLDGEYIFYTRKFNKKFGEFTEIFTQSKKISSKNEQKEIFTGGEALKAPFNDGRNQGGASLTVDNRQLYLTICGIEKGAANSYKNCDIYYTEKKNGEWEKLNKLNKEINNNFSFEGQPSITADGKFLYFSTAREGCIGGMDIYVAERKKDGTWNEAKNLGSIINTTGDEKTPFIHPDGQTLYFSSNGKVGIGGFDIFFSRYIEGQGWSKPINLGSPINTKGDEVAFIISADGERMYFSSNTIGEKTNWDIYSTTVPSFAKPKQVLLVKGKIKGEDGDTITQVKVVVTSLQSKEETEGFVDQSTGDYALSVPVNKDEKFILTAEKKGYFYASELIDPDKKEYVPPTKKDFKVSKIKKSTPFRLANVNFEYDSFVLNDTAKISLKALCSFLKSNPQKKIEIDGHTDNVGLAEKNLDLSNKRAGAVKDYLVSQGIPEIKIISKGFGQTKPLETNATSVGRSKNRRVEFIIIE